MKQTAAVYSDGGKNNLMGVYGSFAVVVNDDEVRHNHFEYENLKTAQEAEVETMLNALTYIQSIDQTAPGRVEWILYLDAAFVVGHLLNEKPKIAKKFQNAFRKARKLIKEHNVVIEQVSGYYMKAILGH